MIRSIHLPVVLILAVALSGCQRKDTALYDKAQTYWLNDKYEEAVRTFHVLVAEYPESKHLSRTWFRIAEITYLNLKDPEKALEYFIKVTKLEGATQLNIKTREYIAEIYERSFQDYDMAVLQYQWILAEFEKISNADSYMYKIGSAYFKGGSYRQAIMEFTTLLSDYPKSSLRVDAKRQIANSLFIIGRVEEASGLYEKILKEHPGDPYEYDIRLSLGLCHEEMDHLDEALSIYKAMRNDFPQKPLVERKVSSVMGRIKEKQQK